MIKEAFASSIYGLQSQVLHQAAHSGLHGRIIGKLGGRLAVAVAAVHAVILGQNAEQLLFLCKLSCGKKSVDMILSNCFAYLMVQLFLIASQLAHVAKHCYCPALCM